MSGLSCVYWYRVARFRVRWIRVRHRHWRVPEISRFHGVVIRMYAADHGLPHFHAIHGGDEAVVGILPIKVLGGSLQSGSLALEERWGTLYQAELLVNWVRLRQHRAPNPLPPLR